MRLVVRAIRMSVADEHWFALLVTGCSPADRRRGRPQNAGRHGWAQGAFVYGTTAGAKSALDVSSPAATARAAASTSDCACVWATSGARGGEPGLGGSRIRQRDDTVRVGNSLALR